MGTFLWFAYKGFAKALHQFFQLHGGGEDLLESNLHLFLVVQEKGELRPVSHNGKKVIVFMNELPEGLLLSRNLRGRLLGGHRR